VATRADASPLKGVAEPNFTRLTKEFDSGSFHRFDDFLTGHLELLSPSGNERRGRLQHAATLHSGYSVFQSVADSLAPA